MSTESNARIVEHVRTTRALRRQLVTAENTGAKIEARDLRRRIASEEAAVDLLLNAEAT